MAVTQAMCTSFKGEVMQALHNFTASTGNTFKIALYTSTATYGAATTAYSATNEITNTSGTAYTAGGSSLTNITPTTSGTTGFADFADVSWSSASFTANGAMIYNSTNSNRAVITLAFGGDKVVSAGTFTIVFPTADATNAIIRIA
jgi:hypothetical protein